MGDSNSSVVSVVGVVAIVVLVGFVLYFFLLRGGGTEGDADIEIDLGIEEELEDIGTAAVEDYAPAVRFADAPARELAS